jgi:hypothetical protein
VYVETDPFMFAVTCRFSMSYVNDRAIPPTASTLPLLS